MCISAVALGASFVVVILFFHQWEYYIILDVVGKIISLPALVSCSVGDY